MVGPSVEEHDALDSQLPEGGAGGDDEKEVHMYESILQVANATRCVREHDSIARSTQLDKLSKKATKHLI